MPERRVKSIADRISCREKFNWSSDHQSCVKSNAKLDTRGTLVNANGLKRNVDHALYVKIFISLRLKRRPIFFSLRLLNSRVKIKDNQEHDISYRCQLVDLCARNVGISVTT